METLREIHMQQRKKLQIILFPVPLQGHINPMLQLANILYSKGFSITIIHTHFNSPNPSYYPYFTFCSIPDALLEGEACTTDIIALLTLLNINCVMPFRDCLAELLSNVLEEEPIACLITDAVWHCTQAVAESLKLPRIVLRTSSVSSFLAFAAFPLLREKGYLPIKDSELEEPVPELPPLKVKDLPVIPTRDPENLYQLLAAMVKETKVSSGLIWNSFEGLEQIALTTCHQDFPIPIFPIGPFHKYFQSSSSSLLTQDQSSIPWLHTQPPKSVIYVSFGSLAEINEKEFLEIAWGLANSNQPFLWVVRPGLICGSEWLEPLPSGFLENLGGRGHIVKWAPQQEVLAHPATGGFWTHCGWNSTLESICEGVPMICLPCFGDQMVNARYLSHVWRIGVHLEHRLERGEVERAIRRVMVEAEGQEMRERLVHLKEQVDLCLRPRGSSYQSLESLISAQAKTLPEFHKIATFMASTGMARSIRHLQPAHFLIKIEEYSLLSKSEMENYESSVFNAGGYKWRLSLYPNGNKKSNGNGYISLYLAIAETGTLPLGWEVNVNFKLFVFDQLQDKYLTIQDTDGAVRRFSELKTEWGFAQLLALDTFNDASNGYLVGDTCIFGAEVFVIESTAHWECLSMVKQPACDCTLTWKIEKFSTLEKELYYSEVFTIGGRKWKLLVYPKGRYRAEGKALSVYLTLDETLPTTQELYAKFKLRIRNQALSNHHEVEAENWFCPSRKDWGFSELMLLKDLKVASKGFIMDDTLIVEAEISVISKVKYSPHLTK